MTEKEKARLGLLYDANYDKELLAERAVCEVLCYEYNQLHPRKTAECARLLAKLLGEVGEGSQILPPFYCDYGYNIKVGKNFFMNRGGIILDGADVTFGDNVFIAPSCGFYTAGHPLEAEPRNKGLEYAYPIAVGDNVWIGASVTVLPGVTIGAGSVIAAGSVVNKSIPAGVLAAGNPCKVIREL